MVHTDCAVHAPVLTQLGYTVWVRPSPVPVQSIQGDYYRLHADGENCCGTKEFIKLYAYRLIQHPVVIIWDLDAILLHPLDTLIDSLLYGASTERGRTARAQLELQHPDPTGATTAATIDAFFTRDITSSRPWDIRQGVQGGFLVAKPSVTTFDTLVEIIRRGNYIGPGRESDKGWGGLGYGGFQGAMAFQGLMAYYYDQIHQKTTGATGVAIELNVCRWNQVVADVVWRGPEMAEQYGGRCRQYQQAATPKNDTTAKCEDCRVTPIELVKSVHYTACKKPWECTLAHPRRTRDESQKYRLSQLTNITTCGILARKWYNVREDLERLWQTQGGVIPSNRTTIMIANRRKLFFPEYFNGYCEGVGQYIPLQVPPDDVSTNDLYSLYQ